MRDMARETAANSILTGRTSMERSIHYIKREVGLDLGYVDYLMCLWEGNDLPAFSGSPYHFSDKSVADRVAQRLSARYAKTQPIPGVMAEQPISYSVCSVEWDDESCPCCGNAEHCSTVPQYPSS